MTDTVVDFDDMPKPGTEDYHLWVICQKQSIAQTLQPSEQIAETVKEQSIGISAGDLMLVREYLCDVRIGAYGKYEGLSKRHAWACRVLVDILLTGQTQNNERLIATLRKLHTQPKVDKF